MLKFRPKGNADKEFIHFLKTQPRFVDVIGKAADVGGRLSMELANVVATLAYVSKVKGTLKEKVSAYEVIIQRLLDVATDLNVHGKFVTDQVMLLVGSADELLDAYKESGADSFQEFICELKPSHKGDKNNDSKK